jgi:hypothetical protein
VLKSGLISVASGGKLLVSASYTGLSNAIVDNGSITISGEHIRLTTSGMCAGVVLGASQTLRMFGLACPANSVSNEQLVRMVVAEIEKHPEQMSKKFSVLASEVIMAAWPCKKYGDPIIVPACVIQSGPFSFCLP